MRTAFINQLILEAKTNDKIFLLVGDLGYSVVEPFAELFPDRFLNVGIAEQNMIGIAVGLSMEGYNVFVYSIGNFPTLRAIEQIRYDVCYHDSNVKIVSIGAGYAYGPLGTSHHTTEDIGMLRTIPNLDIISPSDPIEVQQITTLICNNNKPTYLRLGKAGESIINKANLKVDYGKFIKIKEGKEKVILSTGSITCDAIKHIEKTNLKYGLYSIPFIKPLDLESLLFIATNYKVIITLEEHQKSSGFGSAILEGLNDLREKSLLKTIPFVRRIAINDRFISFAGTQGFLRDEAGLTI